MSDYPYQNPSLLHTSFDNDSSKDSYIGFSDNKCIETTCFSQLYPSERRVYQESLNKKKHRDSPAKDNAKKHKKMGEEDKGLEKKTAEEASKGYIHVRARRGQATDSHSLAERVRREKISERLKLLQSLVPGCDKVTGKALMLDEIINYVQSLQNQVEFLSMKLTSVDPMFYNFGMDMETIMRMNNLGNPLPPLPQCSSTIHPTAFADPNYHNLLDTSAVFLLNHQENDNISWEVDEHRLKLYNQSEYNTNFH